MNPNCNEDNQTIRIPAHKRGDSWNGGIFLFEKEDIPAINPVDLTGVSVLIQFRDKPNGRVVFEFKTEDGTAEVLEPTTGKIRMNPRKMTYPECDYYGDVQITYPGDFVQTRPKLRWQILNDISV
jgi:hypothetical protein